MFKNIFSRLEHNPLHVLAAMVFAVILVIALAACGSPRTASTDAQEQAQTKAANHQIFVPVNDVEFRNYNWRQQISDDPTTLVWCTASFPNPSSPMFTVAVTGKLTSGNKRPYPTQQVSSDYNYFPELPGPDGMYGSSGEYRYGFGPAGKAEYYDWYNMSTFCTTEPKTWQRQNTTLVVASDPQLLAAQLEVQKALAAGDTGKAQQLLENAIKTAQPGK